MPSQFLFCESSSSRPSFFSQKQTHFVPRQPEHVVQEDTKIFFFFCRVLVLTMGRVIPVNLKSFGLCSDFSVWQAHGEICYLHSPNVKKKKKTNPKNKSFLNKPMTGCLHNKQVRMLSLFAVCISARAGCRVLQYPGVSQAAGGRDVQTCS